MKPTTQRRSRLRFVSGLLLLAGLAIILANAQQVRAFSSDMAAARNKYPTIIDTKLDDCILCHSSDTFAPNAFAQDYASHGRDFAAIESLDSDEDGFSNLTEINALTYPGDAADHPAVSVPVRVYLPLIR